ncbi:hypothetical protein [Novacetimonas maltaceti]|uniref:TubC N-terminal docking domain-containing protein n=1 Tax=Novacetimonas maltaceti TaxID=1203393 RepID=A0A2S3W2X6_9PROT|nr:hypothetical protein [Novacetimonas maltaceti]POF63235.1 hypothetical protein KMAL_11430 [Novacetimonas maltaceti]
MVSAALAGLMEWAKSDCAPAIPDPSALLAHLDDLGCRVVLVDGQPAIRGNTAAITPDLIRMMKHSRDAIIQMLEAAGPSTAQPQPDENRSGIRLDPKTGKLHLFGSPDPQWLKGQGWKWDQNRRRYMASYPHDREDATPKYMIGGGPRLPDDYPEIIYAPDNNEDA